MNLIFAGTPDFAALSLAAILKSRHRVAMVLTQPDRPAGRGMKLQPSPVRKLAELHGLPVQQPTTLKDPDAQARLRTVAADIMVVAAYGLILPQVVLDMTPRGAVNVHASLLPRWRGAAPIQRALLAGDAETGICIMQMDAGLDTGPVLLRETLRISPDDDAQTLHDRLAELGARLIVQALDDIESNSAAISPQSQPDEGATYARKIEKSEARIDWDQAAPTVERHIRAFRPFPGSVTALAGSDVKIWRACIPGEGCPGNGVEPGTVIHVSAGAIRVVCGAGTIDLLELQKAGGKRVPVADFLRGNPIAVGTRFGG